MLFWNWKLLLATSAGIFLMLLVYAMQGWNWQVYWSNWRRFFTGSNRQLTVAVGSGGLAALSTYLAASIWVDSENRWIAVGTILQGFGTLLTLILLLWQAIADRPNRDEAKFEQLLKDLADAAPLKRLIAVRQLAHLVSHSRLSNGYRHQLVEYFRLVLSVEQEPAIRDAVLESLQKWEPNQLKNQDNQPLQFPLNLKHSANPIYRPRQNY